MWGSLPGSSTTASNSAKQKSRYVQLIGNLDPGSSIIEVPFNGQNIFPQDQTIKLELVEFSLCPNNDDVAHIASHFAPPQPSPFPPAPEADVYPPILPVRRPVSLPIVKRRRTIFYVSEMGPELMPGRAPPFVGAAGGEFEALAAFAEAEAKAKEKAKAKSEAAARARGLALAEALAREDAENQAKERAQMNQLLGLNREEKKDEEIGDPILPPDRLDDNWDLTSPIGSPLERIRRQAHYVEAKLAVEARFQSWKGTRQMKKESFHYDTSIATLLARINGEIADIHRVEFCGLRYESPPRFVLTETVSRAKARLEIDMAPKTWVFFSNTNVMKLLGFANAAHVSISKRAGNVSVLRNKTDRRITINSSLTEINPHGFISSLIRTEEDDSAMQDITVSLAIDGHVCQFSWDTDHTKICAPGNSPPILISLFTINFIVSFILHIMLLDQDALKASITEQGQLTFPSSGHIQEKKTETHKTSNFWLSITFGSDAAQAIGLRPNVSPLVVSSGKEFQPIEGAFFRFNKESYNIQTDGAGLSQDQLTQFISFILIDHAFDDNNAMTNIVLLMKERNLERRKKITFPEWGSKPINEDVTITEEETEATRHAKVKHTITAGTQIPVTKPPYQQQQQESVNETEIQPPEENISDPEQMKNANNPAGDQVVEEELPTGEQVVEEDIPANEQDQEQKQKQDQEDVTDPEQMEGEPNPAGEQVLEEGQAGTEGYGDDDDLYEEAPAGTGERKKAATTVSDVDPDILAEYNNPLGGGGEIDDYAGNTPLEKQINHREHELQIFCLRWGLNLVASPRQLSKEDQKKFSIWSLQRKQNYPDFWEAMYTREPEAKRKKIPESGRSLLSSGFEDIRSGPKPVKSADTPNDPLKKTRWSLDQVRKTIDLEFRTDDFDYIDNREQHNMLNPWETIEMPNPAIRPPPTFIPWSSWPHPICPAVNPADIDTPLPDSFSLLCPDGERRDFFGPFGKDSFLAKIRQQRTIAYQNYSIIRNPGRKPSLRFEIIDSGYNKFTRPRTLATQLCIKLGFKYTIIANDAELSTYL